ncbi:MAG: hypothetical protein ACOY3P_04820 [Planctomycetota bacterium]
MMKLFAFRDGKDDANKNLGRPHAIDLDAITAMQAEAECQESLGLGKLDGSDRKVETARTINRKAVRL